MFVILYIINLRDKTDKLCVFLCVLLLFLLLFVIVEHFICCFNNM